MPSGQGLVEYALILVLVAVVVIAILLLAGPQVANIFSRVTNGLAGSSSGSLPAPPPHGGPMPPLALAWN